VCELGIASPSRKGRFSVGKRFFLDFPRSMQPNEPQELLFTASESAALDQLLCTHLRDGMQDATSRTKRSTLILVCPPHVRATCAGSANSLC
jgi:hypothetical protein